jgi:NAD(P)-dependent dehydrogenase (short-subunit alcohol dehydrogenase family)
MGKLEGKVALVTGAGSGMGRGVALLFGREGARIGVADCVATAARETAKMIVDGGGQAVAIETDVRKASDAERMVRVTVQSFGRLDILSNNAGVNQVYAPAADITEEEWDRVVDTNLKGYFLGCKYAIPVMLGKGGGVIVNTASTGALRGDFNSAAYCASKGGVLQLTRSMALDYARHNIRVNAICPGLTASGMSHDFVSNPELVEAWMKFQPIKMVGQPEDVARVALFLASDDARYITGAHIVVDGGLTVGGRAIDYSMMAAGEKGRPAGQAK